MEVEDLIPEENVVVTITNTGYINACRRPSTARNGAEARA